MIPFKITFSGKYQHSSEHNVQDYPIILFVMASSEEDAKQLAIDYLRENDNSNHGVAKEAFSKTIKVEKIPDEPNVVMGIFQRIVGCKTYGFEFLKVIDIQ